MKTNNEIPSESRQQVIEELKNTRRNVILTSNIFGLPEAYLQEYIKKNNHSKIITLTEMHEVHPQILLQYASYLESSLTLDLCSQLQKKGFHSSRLEKIQQTVTNNQSAFMIGYRPMKQKKYQTSNLLREVLDMMGPDYDWEWVILNYDKKVSNAEMVQKTMYQYMPGECVNNGPSRVILSAYDKDLYEKNEWNGVFQVITLPDMITYEQMIQECMIVLKNLYPMLQKYTNKVQNVLRSLELSRLYHQEDISASIFMDGIRRFYDTYSCFCASGYLMTNAEMIIDIQEYIQRALEDRSQDDIKKPKLYI